MRHLTSIVAVNQHGVIGAGNALPWRIRTDLRFFREQTLGNVVIMGRKTFDSLGGPLKNRINIVVTHGFGMFQQTESCLVAHSIEEAIVSAEIKRNKRQDVFVIGGATMYEQFAPFVDRYLITDVDKEVPDGDTYFSRDIFGCISDWNVRPVFAGEANSEGDEVPFRTYEMTAKQPRGFRARREAAFTRFAERTHMRTPQLKIKAGLEEVRSTA